MKHEKVIFIVMFLLIVSFLPFSILIQNLLDSDDKKDDSIEPAVVSFTLIDAESDRPIPQFDPLKNGTILNLTSLSLKGLNLRANTEPATVGSVLFRLDDNFEFNIENYPPYALAGDYPPGDYDDWTTQQGWHTITATPYADSNANGTKGTPLTTVLKIVHPVETTYIDGQIIVDPRHPEWLRYHGEGLFFLCGPGDPEGFLYRGDLNPDGTRDGDQNELIDKLRGTGANSIYLQAIRSHGGDGDSAQNPFIDHDPSKGLDEDILDQWEEWFTEMDESGITIFFYFYDDGAIVWDTGDALGNEEGTFIHDIVDRFEHHRRLIWVVAEEYGHAYSADRISEIAAEIRSADDHAHPIAVHHLSREPMAFPDDPNIDQYAMQLYAVNDREELHEEVIKAWEEAAGRYNLNMAEANRWGTGAIARKKNWAVAMGGAYVMILGMDIENTPQSDLEDCGRLVRFMESTNFNEMAPHDELAYKGTEYVLALPGESYIAYASDLSDEIGLRDMKQGTYDFKWYGIENGSTVIQKGVAVHEGDQKWSKPAGIGNELAVYITRAGELTTPIQNFPGETWEYKKPEELGIDAKKLEEIRMTLRGSGLLVKDGYIVFEWGSREQVRGWASSSKPVFSTLLLFALQEGKIASVDEKIGDWGWDLIPKDENMTFRHLANMVSGYARPEKPGEAFAYNDVAIQLYYKTLERVFEQTINEAAMPRLHSPLQLEREKIFNERGRVVLTLQDFARICWFWLNKGNWKGSQLLPESYFEEYMKPGVPIDLPYAPYDDFSNDYLQIGTYGDKRTNPSGRLGPGVYGFNWWFNAPGRMWDGSYFELRWFDAPEDTIFTSGRSGHNTIMIPSHNVVMVTSEGDWSSGHNEIIKLLVDSIIE